VDLLQAHGRICCFPVLVACPGGAHSAGARLHRQDVVFLRRPPRDSAIEVVGPACASTARRHVLKRQGVSRALGLPGTSALNKPVVSRSLPIGTIAVGDRAERSGRHWIATVLKTSNVVAHPGADLLPMCSLVLPVAMASASNYLIQ
jgi:hypothetical protein